MHNHKHRFTTHVAIAIATLILAAPMSANAAILQEDYFTEATLPETSFANDAPVFTLDTVNDELDFLGGGGSKLSGLYNLDAGTTTGTASAVWTLSFDVRASFDDDLVDNLIKIPLIGDGGNLLEIQLAPSVQYTHDLEFFIEDVGTPTGSSSAVMEGLAQDTYYHVDLVVNRTGSGLTDYFGTQDLAADEADFWVDGYLGSWGIDTTFDGAAHSGWLECEIEMRYGEEAGSVDNWVVQTGAYVVDPIAIPTTRTWDADSGDWNVGGNWDLGYVPNDNTHSAVFGDAIGQVSTVFTDDPVTVKDITFDNVNTYIIAGEELILESDSGDATVQVTATGGTHKFQLPVTLASNTDITVDEPNAELIFDSPLNLATFTITKDGAGLLTINNDGTGSGTLDVQEGTVGGYGVIAGDLIVAAAAVAAPGNSIGTLTITGDATIAADGKLLTELTGNDTDLNATSDLLAVGGTLTMTGAEIQLDWLEGSDATSKFGGTYTIATYTSLTGTPTVNTAGNIGAAYIDGALNNTGTALEVTLHDLGDGDTNIDGVVNSLDLSDFGQGWGSNSPTWANGDFNFDGVVNSLDLSAFGQGWGWSAGSAGATGTSPVPEPGTIVMLLIGVAGLLLYRKRR